MHAFVVIRMIHRGMEVINYNYLSYCNKVDFFVYNDDYVKRYDIKQQQLRPKSES